MVKRKFNKMTKDHKQGNLGPEIRRAKVGSICIYEITEDELKMLENGTPNSLYLNFAVALLSVATSFLITLMTTVIADIRIFTIFVVLTAIGFISGIICFILWFNSRRSLSALIEKIKQRDK